MKKIMCLIAVLCLVSVAQASMVAHLDFAAKNTPYTVSEYTDATGNGHNGSEAGTWWNFDGDTDPRADLWNDEGGVRGGVYAHRTAFEQYYETQVRVGNNKNNMVTFDSMADVAANTGVTLAAWVNPETDHVLGGNPDPDYAHVIALGAYGDNPIMTIELDGSKRVHGWVEGSGADTQYEITGTASIAADAWTHIAIVYDRVGNVAQTYVNGVLDNTMGIAGVGDGVLTFSSLYAQVGHGITTHHDAAFIGMIDDVMIFDEVLDASQISALMVPEPATMILLGLGSLVAIRRKK